MPILPTRENKMQLWTERFWGALIGACMDRSLGTIIRLVLWLTERWRH